jgi:hypothetical protein
MQLGHSSALVKGTQELSVLPPPERGSLGVGVGLIATRRAEER